jgi:hypothetical protein
MNELIEAQAALERDGFTILKSAVSETLIQQLIEAVESVRAKTTSPGLRNLLNLSPVIRSFATSGFAFVLAQKMLDENAIPVRAILFDKTAAANWYVTWHQDLSIPVKRKTESEGYGPWSIKEGIVHVQPPAAILERMVSLRVHLDRCGEGNGPIKFIAGSHREGILDPAGIGHWKETCQPVVGTAEVGDVIVMRPLVLHSSSVAASPSNRRVLHLEFAGACLPSKLEWSEA